jgi:hypothetical protein
MADALRIRYACMITLPGVTATDAAKGLYDGSLCWITGEVFPGSYSSVPLNPVTGEAQEDWATDMLMEDSFGSPSFDVDIDALGSYGNQSDMELRANLVRLTLAFLYTYSLYRAQVRFYVVLNEEFFPWCYHVVESFTYEATTLNVYCIDVSKDAHKELPRTKTDRNTFPRISDQQEAKYIPICIGRIPKAMLLGVSGAGERLPLYRAGGTDYVQTAAAVYASEDPLANTYILSLITGDLVVAANQWAGKFLTCVRNGPNDQIEIWSNEASSGGHTLVRLAKPFTSGNTTDGIRFWRNETVVQSGTAQGGGETSGISYIDLAAAASALNGIYENHLIRVVSGAGNTGRCYQYTGSTRRALLLGEWDGTAPDATSTYEVLSPSPPARGVEATWFQLHSMNFSYIVSHYPVYQFPAGRRAFFWDGEGRRFWSAYNAVSSVHTQQLPGYGNRPGAILQGTDPKLSGAVVQSFFPITPAGVRFVSLVVRDHLDEERAELELESEGFPAAEADCPELYDVDKETFLTWTASKTTTSDRQMRSTLVLDIELPPFEYDSGLDALFVAFNMSHELDTADAVTLGMDKRWVVEGIDILEASGLEQINTMARPSLIRYKTRSEGFLLGNVYTGDGVESFQNGILEDYFGGVGVASEYHQTMSQYVLAELSLDQRAIENVKYLRVTIHCTSQLYNPGIDNDHIYKVINRIHEVCLYGRKQVDQNPDKVLIPVIGDMFQGSWGGRRTDGNPILSPVDAAEQIIRRYDERTDLVDTASFDLGVIDRPGALWPVSMQMLEGKNSAEYLDQLCEEGMFIITPRHDGTRAIRCWRERATSYLLLQETEIIEDSIREVGDVDLRRVFNEFEFRYDKNLADGSHQRTVAIRNVDADAFPAEGDVDADPVDLTEAISGYTRENGRVSFTYEVGDFTITPGMFVSLTGGAGGFTLDKAEILEAETFPDNPVIGEYGNFTVLDTGFGMLTEGAIYTSFDLDTCTLYPSRILLWKQYVVGVPDYAVAKEELWEPCHEAWEITRSKNTLRLDFDWFGSHSDWGGDPLNDPPIAWLRLAVGPFGLTKPWKRTAFQLPITETNLGLELGHGFAFRHGVFTGGRTHYAWFTRLALNSKESRIDVEIVFNPWVEV